VIDADLQDPPELLPEMMQLMDDGADAEYGQWVERDGETWLTRVSTSVFYRLLFRMTDVGIPPDTGDFRLMRRPVLEALLAMPEQHFLDCTASHRPSCCVPISIVCIAYYRLRGNILAMSLNGSRMDEHVLEYPDIRICTAVLSCALTAIGADIETAEAHLKTRLRPSHNRGSPHFAPCPPIAKIFTLGSSPFWNAFIPCRDAGFVILMTAFPFTGLTR
jgi:hypothetical protein